MLGGQNKAIFNLEIKNKIVTIHSLAGKEEPLGREGVKDQGEDAKEHKHLRLLICLAIGFTWVGRVLIILLKETKYA